MPKQVANASLGFLENANGKTPVEVALFRDVGR
jgi:hypothetical protein